MIDLVFFIFSLWTRLCRYRYKQVNLSVVVKANSSQKTCLCYHAELHTCTLLRFVKHVSITLDCDMSQMYVNTHVHLLEHNSNRIELLEYSLPYILPFVCIIETHLYIKVYYTCVQGNYIHVCIHRKTHMYIQTHTHAQ